MRISRLDTANMTSSLLEWVRLQTTGWKPSIVGVFKEHSIHEWPLVAHSAEDLRAQLTVTGHLLPLPSEPAALANVMEIELRRHLMERASEKHGLTVVPGTERSYPDLEFSGELVGGEFCAVDIKCARRKPAKKGASTQLNNRIALYTGNTYFLWPQLNFSGILRPFDNYREHISIVVMYTFDLDRPERITDVEVAVHETWRLGSQHRASATREYIGSVSSIEAIAAGAGDFATIEAFYAYWRHSGRNWKKSPEAERLLRRALETRPGT